MQTLARKVAAIEGQIKRDREHQHRRERQMGQELDKLVAEVEELKRVDDSVVQLVAGLVNKIRDLAAQVGDPTDKARILALADDIMSERNRLANAVKAGTLEAPVTVTKDPEGIAPPATPKTEPTPMPTEPAPAPVTDPLFPVPPVPAPNV